MAMPQMAMAPAGPPPGAPAPPPDGAAAGAPVSPVQTAGLAAQAKIAVVKARKQLELSLPFLGTETEEGKGVISALKALSGIFHGEEGSAPSDNGPAGGPPMGGPPMGGPPPGMGGMPMGGPQPGPGAMGM